MIALLQIEATAKARDALVIPKGRALWGSPKEIDFFLWGVLPKGGFWSIHHIFPFALGSLVLWGLKIKNADFG